MVDGDGSPIQPGARIVVTGPGGFVGRHVVPWLAQAGYNVVRAGRPEVGEIHRGTDWLSVLEGAHAVVHLAARVHEMGKQAQDAYDEVNLHGTAQLARQARGAGIKRFIFLSSIKVIGDSGVNHSMNSPLRPADPYAVSKVEAEAALREIAQEMDLVILRPPLVYGPGVGANFARLIRLAEKGWPLPLKSVRNQRSLIFVDNLADAIRYALTMAPGTYFPTDAESLSTPELIQEIAEALGTRAALWPLPPRVLALVARMIGFGPQADRLLGSLTAAGDMMGWKAPISTREGIAQTIAAYEAMK